MQLALGALGLMGGGGAAAGATAAAAGTAAAGTAAAGATTAAATAGSGLSVSGILKGVVGIASALTAVEASDIQAEQFDMKAEDAESAARDEEAKGMQRTTNIKRQMMKALGENAVKFAASGQLVGEGVSEDNALAIEERASSDITVDRADTDARMALHRARAAGWRRVASRTRSAGRARGFIGALSAGVGAMG